MGFHESDLEFYFDMADLWVGTFFYGIYLVLFCICIHILIHRPFSKSNIILLVTAILLFLLSTVQTVINLTTGSAEILEFSDREFPYDELFFADNMIYVVNNVIADGLIIYRCWIIWSHNYFIIIPGIAGLIITLVFGVDQNLPLQPFFWLTLATNLLVSCLTAARIWWIGRATRRDMSASSAAMGGHYASSIAIILESGILYSIFVIARIATDGTFADETVTEMLRQVVGIVPTLIIVRVGLGVSTEARTSQVQGTTNLNRSQTQNLPFHVVSPRNYNGSFGLDSEASFASEAAPYTRARNGSYDVNDTFKSTDSLMARPQPQPQGRQKILAPVRYASAGRPQPIPDLEKGLGPETDWGEKPRSLPPIPSGVAPVVYGR